jgi:hypothetical protein
LGIGASSSRPSIITVDDRQISGSRAEQCRAMSRAGHRPGTSISASKSSQVEWPADIIDSDAKSSREFAPDLSDGVRVTVCCVIIVRQGRAVPLPPRVDME